MPPNFLKLVFTPVYLLTNKFLVLYKKIDFFILTKTFNLLITLTNVSEY